MPLTFGRTQDVGMNDATAELTRRFGRHMNFFYDLARSKYYVGRFLTDSDEYARDHHGRVTLDENGRPRPSLPWRRRQELYGEGETVEEALRFLRGGRPMVGYRPRFDSKSGALRSLHSPSGLIVQEIPLLPEAAVS